ncbi:MAG: phosphodiester glycosidase family protein [Cyanobacteria bacterium P01_F01_bin.150]
MGNGLSIFGKSILSLGLFLPVVFYSHRQNQRPLRQAVNQPLFQGIDYQRWAREDPRPNVLHIVEVNLSSPGIQPLISAPEAHSNHTQKQAQNVSTYAQTTGQFVEASGVQIGINGNYFYEFREKAPWDFYPRSGDPVYVVGEAIGQGDRYGSPRDQWPALCFAPLSNNEDLNISNSARDHSFNPSLGGKYRAQISPKGHCPPQTDYGMAGRDLLIENGQPLAEFPNTTSDKAYSRAAVGTDELGQTLWIVIVDGKQPLYSEGMMLHELADVFVDLDAHHAIALDGGGSSTLVVNPKGTKPQVLNTPMHVKWPHQERPVANHLGLFALPLNPVEDK